MKVAQLGNGLAVQLPEDLVKKLGLKVGDDVEVEVTVATTPVFDAETQARREEALARIRAMRRPFPEGWKFDREDANKRGP